MSNDLISRSEVLKALEHVFDKYRMSWDREKYGGFGREVPETIRNLPTAYDVDKVVEQISELNENELTYGRIIAEIKAGGVSDNN